MVNDLKHAASPSEAMGRRFDASNESFFSGLRFQKNDTLFRVYPF